MRIGIIADIHGNLPALLRVLRYLREKRVDRIYSLGDLVGYNAHPNRCARLVRDLGIESIAGNHDLVAIGRLAPSTCAFRPAFALRRTRRALADDVSRYLEGLPSRLHYPNGVVLLHASPSDVTEYLRGPDDLRGAARALAGQDPRARICFFGHTHEPAAARVARDIVYQGASAGRQHLSDGPGIFFINPGSVDAARRAVKQAEFLIFEPDARVVEFHALAYDDKAAEEMARARGYRMPAWREAAHSTWNWSCQTVVHPSVVALRRARALVDGRR